MANNVVFDILVDNKQAKRALSSTQMSFSKLSSGLLKAGGLKLALIATGLAIAKLGKESIKVSAQFEQWNVAFETMLGSAKQAKIVLNDLTKFAAKTPFQITGLTMGAKQLLAVGFTANQLIPTLKYMGDVAAGLSVPIERLILNLGQIKTQGRLTGRELRDFAVAGVPLIAELAKNLNVTETDLRDMVEAGKIGFDDVEKAFTSMTSEGGRFFNLMDKQSKTFNGMLSNIKDNLTIVAKNIGDALLPAAKVIAKFIEDSTGALADFMQKRRELIDETIALSKTANDVDNALSSDQLKKKKKIIEDDLAINKFAQTQKIENATTLYYQQVGLMQDLALIEKQIVLTTAREVAAEKLRIAEATKEKTMAEAMALAQGQAAIASMGIAQQQADAAKLAQFWGNTYDTLKDSWVDITDVLVSNEEQKWKAIMEISKRALFSIIDQWAEAEIGKLIMASVSTLGASLSGIPLVLGAQLAGKAAIASVTTGFSEGGDIPKGDTGIYGFRPEDEFVMNAREVSAVQGGDFAMVGKGVLDNINGGGSQSFNFDFNGAKFGQGVSVSEVRNIFNVASEMIRNKEIVFNYG